MIYRHLLKQNLHCIPNVNITQKIPAWQTNCFKCVIAIIRHVTPRYFSPGPLYFLYITRKHVEKPAEQPVGGGKRQPGPDISMNGMNLAAPNNAVHMVAQHVLSV